jgi:hypothetical protein
MRTRKLDAAGDYSFGQGLADFYTNSPACIAQKIVTRLLLQEGEWFLDNTAGTPWSQEILGYSTASLRDIAIKAVVLGTPGVTSLYSYTSSSNSSTRAFTVSGSVITAYSTQPIPFGPVTL